MSELRINARLDEQTSEDFQFLREELGAKTITEVLKYSLQQAAQDLRDKARARRQKQIWRDSGFIGAFDGPEDLSTNYKQYLTDMLDAKYPPKQ
jgi:hypothetical protein